MSDSPALPLSLVDDEPALQVLRLVRSLLVEAERLSVSEDSLARMGTVLVAQTAIETLLRCVGERLTDKLRDDASISDVEAHVVGQLKPRGLRHREKAKALRMCRNAVAHHGAVPSTEDIQLHASHARQFAANVVTIVWAIDLEKLYVTSLIENPQWRRWLESAYGMLEDPAYELLDEAGTTCGALEPGARALIAVALARLAWNTCNNNVLWPATDQTPSLFGRLGHEKQEQRSLQQRYEKREKALQFDVLALVLGVRQADVRRFLQIKQMIIFESPAGQWEFTKHDEPPDVVDARFAVEFATNWVLRAQQHVR